MEIRYPDQAELLRDFQPLIAELECGRHYDPDNPQHRAWLDRRVNGLYAIGGTAICLYGDQGKPLADPSAACRATHFL